MTQGVTASAFSQSRMKVTNLAETETSIGCYKNVLIVMLFSRSTNLAGREIVLNSSLSCIDLLWADARYYL
jgi:hypothetical protein